MDDDNSDFLRDYNSNLKIYYVVIGIVIIFILGWLFYVYILKKDNSTTSNVSILSSMTKDTIPPDLDVTPLNTSVVKNVETEGLLDNKSDQLIQDSSQKATAASPTLFVQHETNSTQDTNSTQKYSIDNQDTSVISKIVNSPSQNVPVQNVHIQNVPIQNLPADSVQINAQPLSHTNDSLVDSISKFEYFQE